jgi:pre-mRNA-splicing factor SYF1
MTKRTHSERKEGEETLQQKLFKAPDELGEGDIMSGVNNTYSFRGWWNAILAIPIDRYEQRASVYQRALTHIPGSYKLWFNFLKESRLYVK